MPNETLLAFEQDTGLGPTYAARVIGVAYSTYAQYRSDLRELPLYHRLHIQAVLLLSKENLDMIFEERINVRTKIRSEYREADL